MPALSEQEMAENFGWALAVLRSDKSLYAVFKQAVKGNWAADRFAAAVKNTTWFKQNAEQVRAYQLLKATDPATLNARRGQLLAQMRDAARQMGAQPSEKTLRRISENALMYGWNDNQIRDTLSVYVRAVNGQYHGAAGNDAEAIRQTAWRNGVRLAPQTIQGWVKGISSGSQTVEFYQRRIRALAKSLAPGYAAELDGGMDLMDIAAPLVQAKSKLLEMNPADIDLFDDDIRSALSARTKDGKPATTSLWEFEQRMREKPQYWKTQGAQDQASAIGKKVLSDMGFLGV